MIENIKQLRKHLGLSQNQFATSINITESYLSKLESNSRDLNDRIIRLICLTYNVNEHWLRTGEGDMFAQPAEPLKRSDQEIAEEYLLNALKSLSPEYQTYFKSVCEKFLSDQKNQ